MKTSTLSSEEILRLASWLEANEKTLPEDIVRMQRRIVLMMGFLGDLMAKNRDLLARLREYMGIAPKSEKGSQLANQIRGIFFR